MLDKQNGELPEENETVSEKAFVKDAKEKLAKFWDKVNPIKYEDEEEEIPAAEEAPAEEPVQEEKAPARRKPADAFNIDFEFDDSVKEPAQEVPAQEEAAEEAPAQEEAAEEVPAEETEEAPAEAVVAEETEEASAEEAAEETAEEAPAQEAEELLAEEEEQEAPAKKKLKKWQLGMIISVATLLLVVLVAVILKVTGVSLKPRENNLQYKDSYAAEETALVKNADAVVATLGDYELTVSELQLYYIQGIYTFYSQNQYYLSMIGLDLTAPLADQPYMGDENMTWEQYFLDAALRSWQSYTVVGLLAEQEGFQLDEYMQSQLDSMRSQLNDIAAAYGYASAEEYLSTEMAPGLSPETYVNFNQVYLICNEYINSYYENNYPDGKEITLYYKENEDVFAENGVSRDMGLISDIRHILIKPQGGVTDESGYTTWSEEEWAAALTEAERILQEWKDGEATEESFAELANTYSKDSGSNTNGGLYTDVYVGTNFVPEFKSWAIDFSRRPGDTEIVKTTHGYHIMYFVEGENYFNHVVGDQLVAERVQAKLAEVKETYPMNVDYKKIVLCEPVF